MTDALVIMDSLFDYFITDNINTDELEMMDSFFGLSLGHITTDALVMMVFLIGMLHIQHNNWCAGNDEFTPCLVAQTTLRLIRLLHRQHND